MGHTDVEFTSVEEEGPLPGFQTVCVGSSFVDPIRELNLLYHSHTLLPEFALSCMPTASNLTPAQVYHACIATTGIAIRFPLLLFSRFGGFPLLPVSLVSRGHYRITTARVLV